MKIIWSKTSENDLVHIRRFIADDSEYYADIFTAKLVKSTDNLINFPRMGRIVPEFNIETIREIIVSPYRIIYKIGDNSIEIVTVIHGSRDLKRHIKKSDLT